MNTLMIEYEIVYMNEGMDESMNELMNEWVNRRMYERTG